MCSYAFVLVLVGCFLLLYCGLQFLRQFCLGFLAVILFEMPFCCLKLLFQCQTICFSPLRWFCIPLGRCVSAFLAVLLCLMLFLFIWVLFLGFWVFLVVWVVFLYLVCVVLFCFINAVSLFHVVFEFLCILALVILAFCVFFCFCVVFLLFFLLFLCFLLFLLFYGDFWYF